MIYIMIYLFFIFNRGVPCTLCTFVSNQVVTNLMPDTKNNAIRLLFYLHPRHLGSHDYRELCDLHDYREQSLDLRQVV